VFSEHGGYLGPSKIDGYAGHLGEWELTATLSKDRIRELSGPLIMKHIGLCSQDGPEEKAGQMRLRPSLVSSWIEASLSIDGVECTYSAAMSDSHTGMMIVLADHRFHSRFGRDNPDRNAVSDSSFRRQGSRWPTHSFKWCRREWTVQTISRRRCVASASNSPDNRPEALRGLRLADQCLCMAQRRKVRPVRRIL
jgi:hypothetical protein